ncbi:MAG: alpha/beta hydrolase [Oscillospiraceae bacterium]
MKKLIKVLFIILIVVIALLLLIFLFLFWASKQPSVKAKYYENVAVAGPLEQKYTGLGDYEVSYTEADAPDEKIKTFKIWYPSELENSTAAYPLVVMANGTGVPASKYEAVFEHLASWGFIVVGNEDGESWDGTSSAASLTYMLGLNEDSSSVFFRKIDYSNIGIAGHSQGGAGAINAVTAQENGTCYTALYTASTTHLALSHELQWSYDVSDIKIPYFMTAGTGKSDAEMIAPLSSLEENYDLVSDDTIKLRARRAGAEHGDMLPYADGYMTAWFMYLLRGDAEAGEIFRAENAEILSNSNWQDVEKNF